MAFFSSKKKTTSSSGRPPVTVFADESGGKSLAFGLTWRAVASRSGTLTDAARVARLAGGTHLIFKQQQYGYGAVPADAEGQIHPAAQVAARQHGGDSLYALRVFEGAYWLAVIRGGQPSAVDRVIFADNDVEILELARAEIESGVDDDIRYTVYTNIDSHGLGEHVHGMSAEDLLLMAAGDDDVLVPLPRSSSVVPKPVLYALLAAAVVAIGNKGWGMYQERERARLARLNIVPEQAPDEAWAAVTRKWASERAGADPFGLIAARASLGKTPVLWGGWMLESVSCSATAAGAGAQAGSTARRWSCAARYLRPSTARLNRDMGALALPGWTIQYQGLDAIVASWAVEQLGRPFKFDDLQSVAFHQVESVSRLQGVQPAFSTIGAIKFAPVTFPPPKKSDGTAVPLVSSVPQILEGEISAKGPLRSVDALIDSGVLADWTQLRVGYVSNASGNVATLKSSALTAEVKGVIYARN